MTEIQYVWEHWKFNADQRIKAFNFFVIFAIFADGGVFAALEKGAHPIVLVTVGALIVALAAAFCVIDVRSERLIRLSEPGLLAFEASLGEVSRVFHADSPRRSSWVRYKFAIRGLIGLQAGFGALVITFGVLALRGEVARDALAARLSGTSIVPVSEQIRAPSPQPSTPPVPAKNPTK
jgi:hypothetical protein